MKTKLSVLLGLILSMFTTSNLSAQDVQLATLQQGENLRIFYGADALKEALAASDHGDAITLTAGTFNAVTIEKAVTIQGSGYVTDVEKGRFPTVITGGITVKLPENKEGLVIEGIYTNDILNIENDITASVIRKCRLGIVFITGNSKNCIFDQCRIAGGFNPDRNSENLYIKNSIVNTIGENDNTATLFIENCVITYYVYQEISAVFKNNIISDVYKQTFNHFFNLSLPGRSSAYNNVFIAGNVDEVIIKSGNMISSDVNTLFGYVTSYDDSKNYELTNEAKTTFLGTDGTQVGIYGGDTPFTDIPSNPQIMQKSIATKSTADGKLNVSIKVEAQ